MNLCRMIEIRVKLILTLSWRRTFSRSRMVLASYARVGWVERSETHHFILEFIPI
jgi:hypothetical protein